MSEEVIFKIIEGGLAGEEFVFDEKGLCLIGRSADCALQIPKEKDMRISRRHCLLILEPPNVRIRDLGSRNGTTVNDELLDSGAVSDDPSKMSPVDRILKNGDIISIGETVLKLEVPSEMSQVPPVAKAKLPTQTPPTKVIKLTKPSPTKTGTLIPKSTAVSAGFFTPPSSNANTTSRTIAMTEAISREDVVHHKPHEMPKNIHPPVQQKEKPKVPGLAVSKTGVVDPGPLSPPPPPPKVKVADGGQTMIASTAAAGPLSPPPPQKNKRPLLVGKIIEKKKVSEPALSSDEVPKTVVGTVDAPAKTKVLKLTSKSKTSPAPPPVPPKTEPATAPTEKEEKKEEEPKVLKAKLVAPGSTGSRKIPKKLESHMKTVVMDTKEFAEIPDVASLPDEKQPVEEEKSSKKRVTTFKIKGPH